MWGWIGGIAGGIIGLAGGVVGTYFSVKNTKGPRERSFMIKSAVVCWTGILFFLGLLLALPDPYRWFIWIPYGILLPLGITFGNVNKSIQAKRIADKPRKRLVKVSSGLCYVGGGDRSSCKEFFLNKNL